MRLGTAVGRKSTLRHMDLRAARDPQDQVMCLIMRVRS
jgi:hypothetical protein